MLDLCLSNDNNLLVQAETKDCLINSDHDAIFFTISVSLAKNPGPKISFRKFDNKNFGLINSFLDHNLDSSMQLVFNLEDKYNLFVKESLDGLNIFAPKISFDKKPKSVNYPPALKASIKEKASLWKKQKTDPDKFLPLYKSISLHIKIQIRKFQEKQEKIFLDQNPMNIYKYIGKDFQRWEIPTILHNSQIISDDAPKAEIFANYFSENFQNSLIYPSPPPLNSSEKPSLSEIQFNVLDVLEILTHLPIKNNTSPDDISFNFLRKFHLVLARPLTDLFKLSLNTGKLPKIWKTSIVLPLHKSGDKNSFKNYRPISITCSCCRVLERIIAKRLTDFLLNNNLVSEFQFGFLRKRSTTLQLISTLEDWFNAILSNKKTDCIYLDIIKAFDKVPHDLLIYKIEKIGIKGNLLNWLRDFLTDRSFKVRVNQKFSKEFPIKSGVPQGSVLGPILFLIFINDLPQVIPDGISLKLFADDTKIYLNYSSEIERQKLSYALENVNQWARTWGLEFSPEKSASLYLGKDNFKIPYYINGKPIKETSEIRDLGILIDNKLKFRNHISAVLKKAYLRSRTLLQKIKTKSSKTWVTVYKSYIRPLLEYATEIWNPHIKKEIIRLEKFQKFFTKKIFWKCHLPNLPYSQRLEYLNISTLEDRRKYLDLLTAFKIIRKETHLNPLKLFSFSHRGRSAFPRLITKSKNSKTENSFINRTTKNLQELSKKLDLSSIISIQSYRTKLKKLLEI